MTILVPPSGNVKAHAFRLQPGDSIKENLCDIAQIVFARTPPDECSSLFVMTAVGSLKDTTLRLANASKSKEDTKSSKNEVKRWENQRFEIVSLVGTFSRDGSCHLHMSISDDEGNTFGGHLMAGTVFTTCEVVLGSIHGVNFQRQMDERTGYKELLPQQILSEEKWFKGSSIIKAGMLMLLGYSLHHITLQRRS